MGICDVPYDKDRAGNLTAAVTALATVIFGIFSIGFTTHCWLVQQWDLAEMRRQNKLEMKEQAERFEKRLNQVEKAHHLEVTPRLQLEIDSWQVIR